VTVHRTDFESGMLVKHRLFVALRPSSKAASDIVSCGKLARLSDPVRADRLHMTQFVSDDFESEPVELAEQMQAVLARLRIDAFDVTLTKFGHQGGSLVTGTARPLRHFQSQLARALTAAGIAPRPQWKFNPHVTLGYGEAAASVLNQPIEPITWRALEFELVHSLLRLTIHRTLGRWEFIEQPRLL
jgi:2'-5' RNA ligase